MGTVRLRVIHWLVAIIALSVGHAESWAQENSKAAIEAELKAAWKSAAKTAIAGPASITLADQAKISIGAGQLFIPAAEANGVMHALGNSVQPQRQGLILPADEKASWMVDVNWIKEGYVRDGEAKEWQADALLQSLKDGTEESNAERLERGYPALDITGWVEPPRYDPQTHRLVWSLSARERGAPADQQHVINYNSYALGREGYFSLDLITGSGSIAADKKVAHALLASLEYAPGKRYADFNESTDKVAAYGIGALVGVAAAKKLGLLAVIGLFLAKMWKLVLVGVLAVGAVGRRLLARRSAAEEADPEPSGVEPVAAEADPLSEPESAIAQTSDAPARPESERSDRSDG